MHLPKFFLNLLCQGCHQYLGYLQKILAYHDTSLVAITYNCIYTLNEGFPFITLSP